MSQVLRTAFAFAGLVTVVGVSIIWASAGTEMVALGTGSMSGPFTPIVSQIDTVFPLIVAAFVVVVIVYWFVGNVQDERRVRRR